MPTRQTVHWNNLVKLSEVDECTFQTYSVCHIAKWFTRVCPHRAGGTYSSAVPQTLWSFLGLSAKDSVGGGGGWGISNHSDSQLSTHAWDENIKSFTLCRCVFTVSKELNYLDTLRLKKNAELLWYILALRFIVLELSASSVPENRSPIVVKHY